MAESPLGLSWGMFLNGVNQLGVILDSDVFLDGLLITEARCTPKDISGTTKVLLAIHCHLGLQKIIWEGQSIYGDIFGDEGKQKYSAMKRLISQKYGAESNSVEKTGLYLYDGPDEFYDCLACEGCGSWATFWDDPKEISSVMLELKGTARGEGYLCLGFEGPEWPKVLADVTARREASDLEAL